MVTITSRIIKSSIMLSSSPPTRYTNQWGMVSSGVAGEAGIDDSSVVCGEAGGGSGGEGGDWVVKTATALQSLLVSAPMASTQPPPLPSVGMLTLDHLTSPGEAIAGEVVVKLSQPTRHRITRQPFVIGVP